MKIHQYTYKAADGRAVATPVSSVTGTQASKLSYHGPKEITGNSPEDLSRAIDGVLKSFGPEVPLTTRAHLWVAHVGKTADVPVDATHWFAIAEAIVRQEKEKVASGAQVALWEQWLNNAWPNVEVPESFKALFSSCTDGREALNLLREPDTAMLAATCMIATSNAPITASGLSMHGGPMRLHAQWSDRSQSMSFRAVFPITVKTKASEAFEELNFTSHTASVFKLKTKWCERADSATMSREAMLEREWLKLAHLVNPTAEAINSVADFLQKECGYSLEEILTDQLNNIEKKNGVLSRRVCEVLLNAQWTSIHGQVELLKITEHDPSQLASALIEGFTKHVIQVDKETGNMDLPSLPDLLI